MADSPRWRRYALVAALPAVVLVAVSYSLGSSGPERARTRTSRESTSVERASADGDRREPDDGDARPSRRRRERARVPMTVRVVDLDRRPVADASVDAFARPERLHVEDADEWGAEGRPEEHRVSIASAKTGVDGTATLELPADEEVVFHARDGDRRGSTRTVWVRESPDDGGNGERAEGGDENDAVDDWSDAPRDPVDSIIEIEIGAVAILSGRVSDSRRSPIAGAQITVTALSGIELDDGADDDSTSTRSAADGSYRVELVLGGAFDVEVEAEGFQLASVDALQALGGRETRQDFSLETAEVIAGVVLNADGEPLAGCDLLAAKVGESRGRSETREYEAATDDEGAFRLAAMAPGRYILSAQARDHRVTELFDVPTGSTDVVLRLARGARLEGTIRVRDVGQLVPAATQTSPGGDDWGDDWGDDDDDRRRRPVAKAEVLLVPTSTDPIPMAHGVPPGREKESPSGVLTPGQRMVRADIDASGNGRFTLGVLPGGAFVVAVVVGDAASERRVQLTPGKTSTASFELPDASVSRVRGRLLVDDGRRITRGTIFLSGERRAKSADTTPDGSFVFPWMPPGTYRAQAHAVLEDGGVAMGHSLSVVVGAGETVLDIPLELPRPATPAPGSTPAPPAIGRMVTRGEDTGFWHPDLRIERDVVVSAAPSVPRLFGGDRLVEVDGVSVAGKSDFEIEQQHLEGPKDSICRLRAHRPSTGETLDVAMPRVVSDWDDDEDDW